MKFKFNGGRGAILCEKCGVILKQGREIPEYVWEAVQNGTVNELPGMYCEDNCVESIKVLKDIEQKMLPERLYSIASRLKSAKDDMESYSKIIAKNPSAGMREKLRLAEEEYDQALKSFDLLVNNYTKLKSDEI